jgi:hypothetical protein
MSFAVAVFVLGVQPAAASQDEVLGSDEQAGQSLFKAEEGPFEMAGRCTVWCSDGSGSSTEADSELDCMLYCMSFCQEPCEPLA